MTRTLADISCLIVEDDEPKLSAIIAAIGEIAELAKITTAKSVAGAINAISKERFDFAILDMSLPAFDIAKNLADSGQPQGYGGRDVLRFLEDEQDHVFSMIITQYEEFNEDRIYLEVQNLESISEELLAEFDEKLLGVIFYSGRRGKWREEMKNVFIKFLENVNA